MAQPTFERGDCWFDRLGGNNIEKSDEFPFHLRVLIPNKYMTPRHSIFEYFLDMGRGLIEPILKHEALAAHGVREGADLLFVLPERWMSVHEQHLFLWRLKSHPDVRLIRRVDIITQEALIVGGIPPISMRLVGFGQDDPERGLTEN
jgi:hypothetical protein